ncbi:MAG: Nickel uptake substrate-specific transmembrane region [Methanosaeta sp. PtaB.Bin039]|nr:MAG: Nickel uptake substrate-specific transmembrane region [Methanosaeta sp. PtaB.Bin039]OPY44155.1 MAG: Nickel uptake substrate-specific transmembrane region [Methanosaeta sp. PtaU1.Bin028]HOT07377.1 DUF4198 domain-containing protein [Methanotrichaceae archaeon]HQF17344.1 DUF4198 domain-containing protein [Methanotrichaceae archaeon]HQI91960.1 DUF4198 domain-containing protein [Methanotrichaceae archaeon]
MDPKYMETADLTRIMGGHEIWLGEARLEGEQAEVSLIFGHNMRPDGSLDPSRINPTVYKPDGSTIKPELSSEELKHRLTFPCTQDGFYTAIVDLVPVIITQDQDGYHIGPKFQFKNVTYSGAIIQMAKRIIPVGEGQSDLKEPMHGILEIVPKKPAYAKGEEAEIRVFYEGKPLAEAEVRAVSGKDGKEMAQTKTDEEGWARVPLTEDGEWMFLARHQDPTKKASEEFDQTNFITTLVMVAQ